MKFLPQNTLTVAYDWLLDIMILSKDTHKNKVLLKKLWYRMFEFYILSSSIPSSPISFLFSPFLSSPLLSISLNFSRYPATWIRGFLLLELLFFIQPWLGFWLLRRWHWPPRANSLYSLQCALKWPCRKQLPMSHIRVGETGG